MSVNNKEIDLTYLESIAEDDSEILTELINIFLDQVPEFTEGFAQCYQEKKWKELAGLAHKAKSSVISMGMSNLGDVHLKNLELMAKTFRIKELSEKAVKNEKEEQELTNLIKNLNSYSDEKKEWLNENCSEETIQKIIAIFEEKCIFACEELNRVLEKYKSC